MARISAARGGRPQAPEGGHASWADGSHAPLARGYATGESCHSERERMRESGDKASGERVPPRSRLERLDLSLIIMIEYYNLLHC